jgi:hypothetical protein
VLSGTGGTGPNAKEFNLDPTGSSTGVKTGSTGVTGGTGITGSTGSTGMTGIESPIVLKSEKEIKLQEASRAEDEKKQAQNDLVEDDNVQVS